MQASSLGIVARDGADGAVQLSRIQPTTYCRRREEKIAPDI